MKVGIIVTGGAGYIGIPVVDALVRQGYYPIVIDRANPRGSYLQMLIIQGKIGYYDTDFIDGCTLRLIFEHHLVTHCIHLASFIDVAQSFRESPNYYVNNVAKTIFLLEKIVRYGVKKFVFASSAAVYGNEHQGILHEELFCAPISPYGNTKLVIEKMLYDFSKTNGLDSVIFRFSNVTGGVIELNHQENHRPETHLMPRLYVAAEHREPFPIYGTEYGTPDGTAIRDYIHVKDIADAHLKAIRYLTYGGCTEVINLSSGIGYSILQIIQEFEKQLDCTVTIEKHPSRLGDPAELILNADKAKKLLSWTPRHSQLRNIVASIGSVCR